MEFLPKVAAPHSLRVKHSRPQVRAMQPEPPERRSTSATSPYHIRGHPKPVPPHTPGMSDALGANPADARTPHHQTYPHHNFRYPKHLHHLSHPNQNPIDNPQNIRTLPKHRHLLAPASRPSSGSPKCHPPPLPSPTTAAAQTPPPRLPFPPPPSPNPRTLARTPSHTKRT